MTGFQGKILVIKDFAALPKSEAVQPAQLRYWHHAESSCLFTTATEAEALRACDDACDEYDADQFRELERAYKNGKKPC